MGWNHQPGQDSAHLLGRQQRLPLVGPLLEDFLPLPTYTPEESVPAPSTIALLWTVAPMCPITRVGATALH